MKRRRVEVNIGELDRLLEGARQAPLSDPDYEKISTALHALVDALAKPRSTEKSGAVLGKKEEPGGQPETGSSANPDQESGSKPAGHGRNGADAFESARQVEIQHQQLKSGDSCPKCPNGKVYVQKEPKALIRIVGQAPIEATVYRLERLRCNLCGQGFTAEAPEGVGADKYDETVGSMVAQLKYGSGMPFHRLEKLEQRLGVPLPATTQWEIVEEAAEVLKPAHQELIRQAGQGEILHNDDTSMKILKLQRPAGDTRTGVFTSGIVSIRGSDRIASAASATLSRWKSHLSASRYAVWSRAALGPIGHGAQDRRHRSSCRSMKHVSFRQGCVLFDRFEEKCLKMV